MLMTSATNTNNVMTHNTTTTTTAVTSMSFPTPGDGDALATVLLTAVPMSIWSSSWSYPDYREENGREGVSYQAQGHLRHSHSSSCRQCENTRFVRSLQRQIILGSKPRFAHEK